jgi:hypothetical protein
MSAIREIPLLGGDFSSQRLNPIHDTRRLRICRSQMVGEKCDSSVIAVIPVTRPVYSPELHEGQLLSPVQHPAGYSHSSAEILDIFVSLRGRRGHTQVLRAEHQKCQRTGRSNRSLVE